MLIQWSTKAVKSANKTFSFLKSNMFIPSCIMHNGYGHLSAQSGDLNDPGIPIKRYR